MKILEYTKYTVNQNFSEDLENLYIKDQGYSLNTLYH